MVGQINHAQIVVLNYKNERAEGKKNGSGITLDYIFFFKPLVLAVLQILSVYKDKILSSV